jgi:nucleotide-binding universal stress UspA family protein
VRSGPVVIAHDGSPASEHAIREAGALLAGRPAIVVVVWKPGLGSELVMPAPTAAGLPPAELDVRTALEADRTLYAHARQLARQGAALARGAGFAADGLAVADDLDVPVSDTVVRVARERDAQAVVMGVHVHGHGDAAVLARMTRNVIRDAPCPVVVVRDASRHPER